MNSVRILNYKYILTVGTFLALFVTVFFSSLWSDVLLITNYCRLHKMTLKLKSTRPAAGLPANNRTRTNEDGTVLSCAESFHNDDVDSSDEEEEL